MPEMLSLRHCPFCRGDADITDTMPGGQYWIRCDDCGASAEGDRNPRTAIANWNRREGQAR